MSEYEPDATDVTQGAETLLEVLDAAAHDGYEGQLVSTSDGGVRCVRCGEISDAKNLRVDRVHRLEGASDAADMMLVGRCRCPRCAVGATIVLGYGPNASEEDDGVLRKLDVHGAARGPVP